MVSATLMRVWYAAVVAIVLQSVWIGGGIEALAKYGSYGWIAILISAVTLVIILILSLEVARTFKAYDYMTWSKQFLWKAWLVLDIAYIIMALTLIAIVGTAARHMLSEMTGMPFALSAAIIIAIVGVLHFYGRRAMEAFWVIGTIGLYIMYFILWGYMFAAKGDEAFKNLAAGLHRGTPLDAAMDGFRYVVYNLSVIFPALVFVDRFKGRFESLIASILAVILIYGAATAIWISFMAYYPNIIGAAVTWYDILKPEGPYWLLAIYVFWIFYTLVETALGMIYALIRRIDAQLKLHGITLGRAGEALLSAAILFIAIIIARTYLIVLMAKGYGTMAWVFFIVYVIPLITIGVLRLLKPEWRRELWAKA